MDTITIAVLLGTAREKRESVKAAHYVAEFGKKLENVEIIFVDPRELNLPGDGEDAAAKDPKYSEITARADAFFIVTPEYNHSIPGSLKRMIDSEYSNYKHKPVAVAGVSNGPWGGVRVCEALLPVTHRTGMISIQPEVYFPKIQDIFDEAGQMKTEFAAMYEKNVGNAYQELIWMARLFKHAQMS
jgi:NAD(P)H-dependent FMN reductase